MHANNNKLIKHLNTGFKYFKCGRNFVILLMQGRGKVGMNE